eukprot:GHVO01036992.1.p1 GENE.GHVO01036992.1~~GHVO01036992.1.p1  ORF type:complete len:362 (-),score=7.91 GHVO01036992.1:119-1204(-)
MDYELKIFDTQTKIDNILKRYKENEVMLSYSGGSDSEVLLHMLKEYKNIKIVFFNTGLEYQATIDQVLKRKAEGFNIDIVKPEKSATYHIKKNGVPFISKETSTKIELLKNKNFSFNEEEHGSMWWSDDGMFSIQNKKYLKSFLSDNELNFKISSKCCDKVKKDVSYKYAKDNKIKLSIIGLRKAEGGIRAKSATCFRETNNLDYFNPLLLWTNEDKLRYIEEENINLSKCYTVYGLKRTGCVGCPFSKDAEKELNSIKEYEPKKAQLARNLFKDSYQLTKEFNNYAKRKRIINRLEKKYNDNKISDFQYYSVLEINKGGLKGHTNARQLFKFCKLPSNSGSTNKLRKDIEWLIELIYRDD